MRHGNNTQQEAVATYPVNGPERAPNGSQMCPNGPRMSPKGPKRAPKWIHMGLYGAHIGPEVSVEKTLTVDSPRPTFMRKTNEKVSCWAPVGAFLVHVSPNCWPHNYSTIATMDAAKTKCSRHAAHMRRTCGKLAQRQRTGACGNMRQAKRQTCGVAQHARGNMHGTKHVARQQACDHMHVVQLRFWATTPGAG
jgi:hypothetical protein